MLDPQVNKSYSKISIYIIRLLILSAITIILNFTVVMFDWWFYNTQYDNYSREIFSSGKGEIQLIVSATIIYFSDAVSDLLCIIQVFEWIFMINIITYQDGKLVAEIMYLTS